MLDALSFAAPGKYPRQFPRPPQSSSIPPSGPQSFSYTVALRASGPCAQRSLVATPGPIGPGCAPLLAPVGRIGSLRARLGPSIPSPQRCGSSEVKSASSEPWSAIPGLPSSATGYSAGVVPPPALARVGALSHFPRLVSPSRVSAGIRASLPVLFGWGPNVGGRRQPPQLEWCCRTAPPCAKVRSSAAPGLDFECVPKPSSNPSRSRESRHAALRAARFAARTQRPQLRCLFSTKNASAVSVRPSFFAKKETKNSDTWLAPGQRVWAIALEASIRPNQSNTPITPAARRIQFTARPPAGL